MRPPPVMVDSVNLEKSIRIARMCQLFSIIVLTSSIINFYMRKVLSNGIKVNDSAGCRTNFLERVPGADFRRMRLKFRVA